MRNFLIQALMIEDERREKFQDKVELEGTDWKYREIRSLTDRLYGFISTGVTVDRYENQILVETFETAQKIYYSRIMNMFAYYRETSDMVKVANGSPAKTLTNVGLLFGGPRKKVA